MGSKQRKAFDIKSSMDAIMKDLEGKMDAAKKVGDVIEEMRRKSEPIESKDILVEGVNCVAELMPDNKVSICFHSKQSAQEYYAFVREIKFREPEKKKGNIVKRIFKWLTFNR